jgi:hypothetical protein
MGATFRLLIAEQGFDALAGPAAKDQGRPFEGEGIGRFADLRHQAYSGRTIHGGRDAAVLKGNGAVIHQLEQGSRRQKREAPPPVAEVVFDLNHPHILYIVRRARG